jgi:hypothetical protein
MGALFYVLLRGVDYFDMPSPITKNKCTRPALARWLLVNISRGVDSSIKISW